MTKLGAVIGCIGVAATLCGCSPGGTGANAEARCNDGITRLQTALSPGGAAANAAANARTEAEDELEEALEARQGRDWDDCIDALQEAFTAVKLTF